MRRAGPALLAAAGSLLAAGWGSALASAIPMKFTRWVVTATNSGASVSQNVAPGGTFRICSSSKLIRLEAHYRSRLASGTSVHTVWRPPGQPSFSEPGKAFSKGYFYLASNHGLPDGTWKLKVVRHGRRIASSSVTIAREHC